MFIAFPPQKSKTQVLIKYGSIFENGTEQSQKETNETIMFEGHALCNGIIASRA